MFFLGHSVVQPILETSLQLLTVLFIMQILLKFVVAVDADNGVTHGSDVICVQTKCQLHRRCESDNSRDTCPVGSSCPRRHRPDQLHLIWSAGQSRRLPTTLHHCRFDATSSSLFYTVFRKKHPLTVSFISPWTMCRMCGFKQKLQWIYLRNGRF